jgi:hypothetical protein
MNKRPSRSTVDEVQRHRRLGAEADDVHEDRQPELAAAKSHKTREPADRDAIAECFAEEWAPNRKLHVVPAGHHSFTNIARRFCTWRARRIASGASQPLSGRQTQCAGLLTQRSGAACVAYPVTMIPAIA